MKICNTQQEYIKLIVEPVQRVCKRYGYLPSVLIAQSCLENGYGIRDYWDNPQIEALLTYNNMVGIKSELLSSSWNEYTVWTGESLSKKTPEEYNGKKVIITDSFRKYDTIERSFADFLLFLTYASNYGKGGAPKYGKAVLSIKDPETLIRKVSSLGYATDSSYANSVMKIIRKHNLTKYDDLSKVKATIYTPGYKAGTAKGSQDSSPKNSTPAAANIITLKKRTIHDITAANRSQVPASRGGNPISFIVVHYLGVPNADNPYLYGGGYGGHYNIQRNGQIYYAANPRTAVVWHCGGGLQGSGGHTFHRICTNYNSIGIECGVAAATTSKDLDGDSGLWYFTEQTQESLVYLVSKLMDEYGISFDHVIRHYDVTGKICPNPYVKNNNFKTSWTWNQFKNNLKQYRQNGTITIPNGTKQEEIKYYRVRKEWKDESSQLGAYINLQNAKDNCPKGYKVFDWNGKQVYQTKESTADKFIAQEKNVCDTARKDNWNYGNSKSIIPCDDKNISCDRMVSRALYNLGYTDQRAGGEVCITLPAWLNSHGWKMVSNVNEIKPGAIVAVRKKDISYIDHVFVVSEYNPKTGYCSKYDCGSQARINTIQPFKNVKLLEWSNKVFVAAWNVPDSFDINKKDQKNVINNNVYNGVDYSAVYDYSYYRQKYIDLKSAFKSNKQDYFKHFCEYGMKEGRQASPSFNVNKYKNKYKDLQKVFGDNLPEYYKHYCLYGKKEGRQGV